MKLIFLIAFVVYLSIPSTAQTIELKRLKGSNLSWNNAINLHSARIKMAEVLTPDNITVSGKKIKIYGSTIQCNKITFNEDIKQIRTRGDVLIRCNEINFEQSTGSVIKFKKWWGRRGHLTIEHSGNLTMKNLSLIFRNAKNLQISVLKK